MGPVVPGCTMKCEKVIYFYLKQLYSLRMPLDLY